MKKIGTINCGCEENCGGRIRLVWSKKGGIVAYTPHGEREKVEQHYSRHSYNEAIDDCVAWYDNCTWQLDLFGR